MTVPIPARIAKLDRDKRGYPVPVIVSRDHQGAPHFAVNDVEAMAELDKADGCSICGMKLTRGRWLVGGCMSAFAARGWFADGPLHHECATYALKVCPYLAAPSFGRINKAKAAARADRGMAFDISVIDSTRPVAFVAIMSVAVETKRPNLATWFYRPRQGSIRRIEIWRHGTILGGEERAAFREHAEAMLARHDQPWRDDLDGWIG